MPTRWQTQLPQLEWAQRRSAPATPITEPQQATLGQHDFTSSSLASEGMTPLENTASAPVPLVETQPKAAASTEAVNNAAAGAAKTEVDPATPTTTKPAAIASAKPIKPTAPAALTAKAASAVAKIPVGPAAAISATTIKYRTGRYYVIAGAYSSLKGAERGRQVLARTGHATHIILPPFGSRLFRLTAADYPDLASAQREALRLRVSTHCDYNTLKF